MTKLVWGQLEERRYETGVSHGILYPKDGPGIVWNGLTSVNESFVGGGLEPLYFDGIKYLDFVSGTDFQAVIKAFSAPPEFSPCVGEQSPVAGLVLTGQPKKTFDFSYRTLVSDIGYKIHLVYNALASPLPKSYSTMANSPTPTVLEWKIDSVPPPSSTRRPTAYLIIDSTKLAPSILSNLELTLYGSVGVDPVLPPQDTVINMLIPV